MADARSIDPHHMAELQEAGHAENHDYVGGSPHLRHRVLHERVVGAVAREIQRVDSRQGTCSVLEVGAGHGTFTEAALAAGSQVTVTEMSKPSAEFLQRKFADNPSVTIVYDKDGDEAFRRQHQFDVVLFISVLHHIPDYLGLLRRMTDELVRPGGAIVTYQDPLWYPRQSGVAKFASWTSYFAWRMRQGELTRGLGTRWRHIRKQLDESKGSDMIEYHVIRDGVDDEALRTLLAESYKTVKVDTYWSTQSAALQTLGTGRFPPNTFGVVASDRRAAI